MKSNTSVFEHQDHRIFLREALKEKGFSYRSFALKHGDVASFDLLASALSKGKSGTKNKPRRDFSPMTLARLGKTLGLSDVEVEYLIILKLENDSEVLPGLFGDSYQTTVKRLGKLLRIRRAQSLESKPTTKNSWSVSAEAIASYLDLLPANDRIRILKGLHREAQVVHARARHRPGVKAVTNGTQYIADLITMGAP